MKAKTVWETFKAEGENVVEKVKQVVHEGNVRRVVVKHQGRKVAEFPLTAGVVGAVLAPVLAAIGAFVALMKDCTIAIERTPIAGPPAAWRYRNPSTSSAESFRHCSSGTSSLNTTRAARLCPSQALTTGEPAAAAPLATEAAKFAQSALTLCGADPTQMIVKR